MNFKLIATNVNKKTGQIIGENCYGEEKVNRLKKIGVEECNYFYSDSLSDEPVKNISKKAFIVKKDDIIDWEKYEESFIEKYFLNRDFITFVFIGCINAFNGIWISLVYSIIISNVVLSYILGFLTSLIIAYILNSTINFKQELAIKKFVLFSKNNIPNFVIQVSSVLILYNVLNVSKFITYFISAIIAVPITFLLVKINVFNNY